VAGRRRGGARRVGPVRRAGTATAA
jgi:hypothetical protein